MRRVVITGLGLVTPLGSGVEHVWKGIVEGRSGIGPITCFDTEGYGCTIAGEVPSVDGRGGRRWTVVDAARRISRASSIPIR